MRTPELFEKSMPHTVEYWEKERRNEILHLMEENVYGITPDEKPDSAEYSQVSSESGLYDGTVCKRSYIARFKRLGRECSFHFHLFAPTAKHNKLPVVIMINTFSAVIKSPLGQKMAYEMMPADRIIKSGYAIISADVCELCADDPKGAYNGLLSMYPSGSDGQRASDGWGALGAWAWAVSRIIDYLKEINDIDTSKIAVTGCSRAAKAALWCAAQDQRIALAISSVSGCAGAAYARIRECEIASDLARKFPHWICENYAKNGEDIDNMPVDQHMLLALIAPRPHYVCNAVDDEWASAMAEYKSCVLASEIYEMYGKKGVSSDKLPPHDSPIMDGDIGYHLRTGKHGCTLYDWEQFLKFMNKYFKNI